MGLKVETTLESPVERSKDKIRPKWDWKIPPKRVRNSMERRIKSDQNGIERYCLLCSGWLNAAYDKIRPKWDWKAARITVSASSRFHDKIRPKWDWKYWFMYVFQTQCKRIKSDQNGIERRKFPQSWLYSVWDKIRPKWDWKCSRRTWGCWVEF